MFMRLILSALLLIASPAFAAEQTSDLHVQKTGANQFRLLLCRGASDETCEQLGSRDYTTEDLNRAATYLRARGWLGLMGIGALAIVGSGVGIFVAPGMYLATATVVAEGQMSTVIALHGIGLIGGFAGGVVTGILSFSPNKNFQGASALSSIQLETTSKTLSVDMEDLVPLLKKALAEADSKPLLDGEKFKTPLDPYFSRKP